MLDISIPELTSYYGRLYLASRTHFLNSSSRFPDLHRRSVASVIASPIIRSGLALIVFFVFLRDSCCLGEKGEEAANNIEISILEY